MLDPNFASAANLGPCCMCESTDYEPMVVAMINRLAPQPGTGWGCAGCNLPPNGAVAVLCESCAQDLAEGNAPLKYVINGKPENRLRFPFENLSPIPFNHKGIHKNTNIAATLPPGRPQVINLGDLPDPNPKSVAHLN